MSSRRKNLDRSASEVWTDNSSSDEPIEAWIGRQVGSRQAGAGHFSEKPPDGVSMASARQSDSRLTSPRCTRGHLGGDLLLKGSREMRVRRVVGGVTRRSSSGHMPPPYNFSKLVDKLPSHVLAVMSCASSDVTK